MGCDGREDGFPEFRENGTREIWEVRVALYHNGSRIEIQVDREKLRRTEALYMRSARRSFGWEMQSKCEKYISAEINYRNDLSFILNTWFLPCSLSEKTQEVGSLYARKPKINTQKEG